MSLKGHTLSKALLRMRPWGTGPYDLESKELLELSPSSQTCPRGTTSVETKPVLTLSPGSAVTLLQMYSLGLVGHLAMMISPRSTFLACGVKCSVSRTLLVYIVGSIEGPVHYKLTVLSLRYLLG